MRIAVRDAGARGRGVFATEAIAAGTTIETCCVLVVPAAQLPRLDGTILYDYYFGWGEDGAIATGFGSFYNHADVPNAEYRKDFAGRTLHFVALRNIGAGEEITIRYNTGGANTPLWFQPI